MVQQIKIITRPSCEFDIPASEGYRLYSSLLSCMKDADNEASSLVHDSARSSIHLSCLKGKFFRSDRPNFKRVVPGERYMFHIGVTDPAETKIFQAIVKPLIFDRKNLDLEGGELIVEDFGVDNRLIKDAFRKYLEKYDEYMKEEFSHPRFEYTVNRRKAIRMQAILLRKAITGELKEYHPLEYPK